MINRLIRYVNDLTNQVDLLDRQTWLVLFAVVIVVGILCLRGFGSRSAY